MRRRALLAASAASGGPSLFPINLIEGDNGQVGVSLYNFVLSLVPENQQFWVVRHNFEDGEVTIADERCLMAYADSMEVGRLKRVQLLTPTYNAEGMSCYFLYSDGMVELFED
jgi:hypothetical protein